MDLSITLSTESARMGTLMLDGLAGRARISSEAMTLDPMRFGLFGGKYEGTAAFSLGQTPDFRVNAALSGLDVAAMMAFAGSPGTMTGRLSGTIDLAGAGTDAATAMRSARGTSRVDIANGTVRNLGLVRTIIIATSGRSDAMSGSSDVSRDERFSRLRSTLAIAGGGASTRDLIFESDDLLLSASGSFRLDASAIDLAGQVQLSEALASRAGRDLVRYTQEQGRPTLPVRITGSAANPQVTVDVAGVLQRAITNRATEEVQKAMKKGLGGIFRR
jgi:AsmA protein